MRLCEELAKYSSRDVYPMHMPGHKRNPLFFGAASGVNGANLPPELIDITEIYGFDDLHGPQGIIKEEQERAARLFGSDESFILVNGSTCGNLAGISALVPPGGKVLVLGNCHQSVYSALKLRQAKTISVRRDDPDWVPASIFEQGNIDDVCLVIITYPAYDGQVCDIKALADACHARGIPLLADAAHGAHLKFCRDAAEKAAGEGTLVAGIEFPQDALVAGADIVINSLHKTLPSMTGTSLLHVNTKGGLVDVNKVRRFLDVFQTTSPSYVLMSSISFCLKFLEEGTADEDGRQRQAGYWFTSYVNRLARFYKDAGSLKNLKVLSPEGRDPGKIVIFPPGDVTGPEFMDMLRRDFALELERSTPEYVLAMTSVCDTDEGFERLLKALTNCDTM